MFETIQMAFIGTIVGVAISLPLSMFAARNLNSKYVYGPVRAILAAIRTFPSILWAILFVIMVGLGPFAGVLAIIMYTRRFKMATNKICSIARICSSSSKSNVVHV
jgi:phosphonate transport system permease protein